MKTKYLLLIFPVLFIAYLLPAGLAHTALAQDGAQAETVKKYFKDGSVKEEWKYVNGQLNGTTTLFYPNGKISDKTEYKNGEREGSSKTFYKNGKLKEEWIFSGGLENGEASFYFETGELEKTAHYTQGKLDGFLKIYDKNGSLKSLWLYKDDELEGISKEFYEDGTTQNEWLYHNDKLSGISNDYYKSGKIFLRKNYENNKRSGITTRYDEDGSILRELRYFNGHSLSERIYIGIIMGFVFMSLLIARFKGVNAAACLLFGTLFIVSGIYYGYYGDLESLDHNSSGKYLFLIYMAVTGSGLLFRKNWARWSLLAFYTIKFGDHFLKIVNKISEIAQGSFLSDEKMMFSVALVIIFSLIIFYFFRKRVSDYYH